MHSLYVLTFPATLILFNLLYNSVFTQVEILWTLGLYKKIRNNGSTVW